MAETDYNEGMKDDLKSSYDGKGTAEKFPKPTGKSMDSEAPEVKKKDAAQYKETNDMYKQSGYSAPNDGE